MNLCRKNLIPHPFTRLLNFFFLFFFLGKVKGSLRWRGTFANYTEDRRVTGRHGVVRVGGGKKNQSQVEEKEIVPLRAFFLYLQNTVQLQTPARGEATVGGHVNVPSHLMGFL